MPKPITTRQRLEQANVLIQKARELPIPSGLGYRDLAYIAQVKDVLRQARDLVKFIQYSPSLTDQLRQETGRIMLEIMSVEKELLRT
jgi:hypothetical protein